MARPAFSREFNRVQTITLTALTGAALTAHASNAGLFKFRAPYSFKVIGATLNVGQRGGTHATSTLQISAGATPLITAAFDIAALTPATPVDKEGSALAAAADSVAKDTVMTVATTVSGGSSPTWADVTLQIDVVPLGD